MTPILFLTCPLAVHVGVVQRPLPRAPVVATCARTAVFMSDVPPQWKGPAVTPKAPDVTEVADEIKELLQEERVVAAAETQDVMQEEEVVPTMTPDVTQEEEVVPTTTLETIQEALEVVPRLDDLEAMLSDVMTPEAIKESAEKKAFFLKAWANEKVLVVEELAAKAKDLEVEDIKAAVVAKAPEVKAEVQAKAKAALQLLERFKQTEAARTAAGKTASAYQAAVLALEESYGGQKLKESYAAAQKSELYKKAAEACASMVQTLQAKAEEAELMPKARAVFEAALEKSVAARLALIEYIEANLKGK
jgi:hypothetical protein